MAGYLTHEESDNVTDMVEAAIPRIGRVELVSGGDVKDEIAEGCLETIEGKVEGVEA